MERAVVEQEARADLLAAVEPAEMDLAAVDQV